jgi:hypothetical protein
MSCILLFLFKSGAKLRKVESITKEILSFFCRDAEFEHVSLAQSKKFAILTAKFTENWKQRRIAASYISSHVNERFFACRAIDAPLAVPYVYHWAANGICLRGRLSVERSFICIAW